MPAVGHTHAFILLRFFLVFSVDFVNANPEGVLPLQVCTWIDSNNLPYSTQAPCNIQSSDTSTTVLCPFVVPLLCSSSYLRTRLEGDDDLLEGRR